MLLRRKKNAGIALLMCLLLLIILVVIVGQFSYSTQIDAYVAGNDNASLQIRYALLSAVNVAIAQLQLDAMKEEGSKTKYDTLLDEWANPFWSFKKPQQIGNLMVSYEIRDEHAKFNLIRLWKDPKAKPPEEKKENDKDKDKDNDQDKESENEKDKDQESEKDQGKDKDKDKGKEKPKEKVKPIAPEQQFDLLGKILQGDKPLFESAKLREAIVGWMKNKRGKPDSNAAGPFPNKVPLYSMKELQMADNIPAQALHGISDSKGNFFPGLLEYTTLWSDGLININTATGQVLASLSPRITPEIAKSIVAYREQVGPDGAKQIFQKKEDFKKNQGLGAEKDKIYSEIESLITVNSSFFSIVATASTDKITRKLTVVVYREGKRVYKLFGDYE